MTRARTASSGMGSLAAIQPLLGAALMLCVSLVQTAATTLGMILNRRSRDWHTQATHEALPQATSGPHSQGTDTPRVMLGPVPSISVGTPQGLADIPRETINRDARHTGEPDTVDVTRSGMEAWPLACVPGGGRDPVLREAQTRDHRSALTRAAWAPACARNTVERFAPTKT